MSGYKLDDFSITVSGGKITDVDGVTMDHSVNLYDIELTHGQVMEMAIKGFQQGPTKVDLFSDNDWDEPSTNVLIALRHDGAMRLVDSYDDLIWLLHDNDWKSATYYQVQIDDNCH